MKKLNYFLLVGLVLFFAACSGGGNKEGQTESNADTQTEASKEQQIVELTIKSVGNTMQEMRFDHENITVPAGAKVKITLINEGTDPTMIHNIVFVQEGTMEVTARAAIAAGPDKEFVPNSPTVIAASPLAQPGETVSFEFDAPEAGTYEFFCSYPGHWQQMNGKFIIE